MFAMRGGRTWSPADSSSPVLTRYGRLPEGEAASSQVEKERKVVPRSLSFSSLLPLGKRRKLRISKFCSSRLRLVEDNSCLAAYYSSCPGRDHRLGQDDTLSSNSQSSHSLPSHSLPSLASLVTEIERFEAEFCDPTRQQGAPSPAGPQCAAPAGQTESVAPDSGPASSTASDCDSGAFSRESTPDFSMEGSCMASREHSSTRLQRQASTASPTPPPLTVTVNGVVIDFR